MKNSKKLEKTKGLIGEFKEFVAKGNVVDLAVGVIIGGAFGKIVTSLVSDIIMPLVGLLIGNINISAASWTVQTAADKEPVVVAYGMFLQNIIDFLIIALCIFIIIKVIGAASRKRKAEEEEEKEEEAPEPTKEEQLLQDIKELLQENLNK